MSYIIGEDVKHSYTPIGGEPGNYKYDYVSFGDGMRAQGFDAGGGQYIAGADTHSDNMASSSVSTRLAGETTLSSAVKLQNYTAIRNLNFMLCNLDNCVEKGSADYNQYVGEAYYFRAWYYYQMFISYGRLTWVNTPLDPNMEEMKLPRANRTIIADSIMADLDKAVMYLNTQNNSATMRIHKDVARALKSEVALFEGTWEKYHKAKNDKFFDSTVTDEKIRDYFNQAVAAARLGGIVTFVGKIGDDIFGKQAVQQMEDEGINVDYVAVDQENPSSVALITE